LQDLENHMNLLGRISVAIAGLATALFAAAPVLAQAPATKPSIVVIMGDDIGCGTSVPTTAA
jgi:hypothetical protein